MAAAAPSSVTSGDTDRRHKKLLLMQKKMQMSDAMEKRVQLESFAASRGGGRAVLSKNMRISIENDLDVALAAAGSGFGGSSPGSIASKSGRHSSLSLAEIRSSPFLSQRLSALEKDGKLQRSRSQQGGASGGAPPGSRRRRTSAKGDGVRLAAMGSRSLPDIRPLEQPIPTAAAAAAAATPARPSPVASRASHAPTGATPLSKATAKRYAQAEMMIKQAVQRRAKDLKLLFTAADTDGSGDLNVEEMKSVLYKLDIIFEDRHFDVLMRKIDNDGSGDVSYNEFVRYFGKGSEADRNLTRKVTGSHVTVQSATKMIRNKIEGRMGSGPSVLRRAFQLFDGDGSGTISKQEFAVALKQHCSLEFEPHILEGVLKAGSGDEMDFNTFSAVVMGSSTRDRSSLGFNDGASRVASDTNGNSEQMIRRKVREHWKPLHVAFKHADRDKTGKLGLQKFTDILESFDIIFSPDDFAERAKGAMTGGGISYSKFLKPFGKGSNFDKQLCSTIKGVTRKQAKQMIVEKLQGRITGGPAGLRRAFKFFDRDGNNGVSFSEFTQVVTENLGLALEPKIFAEIFAEFAGGKEEMDLYAFSNHMMDSKRNSTTSFDTRSLRKSNKALGNRISAMDGNSEVQIRRKVRESWKNLQFAFQHADRDGTGIIRPNDLREVLESFDIILADTQFNALVAKLDSDGDGSISYEEFFGFFSTGQKDETLEALVGIIKERDVSVEQAKVMIRGKIQARLKGGPSELRRTFQLFDADGGGTIDTDEFKTALVQTCGLQFEKKLIDKVMHDWSQGTGNITWERWNEFVMESKRNSSTSFGQHMRTAMTTSNDSGNSLQFVVRKVRERFKELVQDFKHTCDKQGCVTPDQLREVLFRFNIIMSDDGFKEMLRKIDTDGDGQIQYQEFTALFAPGRKEDKDKIATITHMSVDAALQLILEKVRGRLPGGPSEMRRSFQFFDRDGGGSIDLEELKVGLEKLCGLRFSDKINNGLMKIFSGGREDGKGEMNYLQFCKYVLGSSGESSETSFVNDTSTRAEASDAKGNSAKMLRRKVREKWKPLIVDFKHRDPQNTGLLPEQLQQVLYKHDIIFADKDFDVMCRKMDSDNDGTISYGEFLTYFAPGQEDEKMTAAELKTLTAPKAIVMIRERVESRLPPGPGGLRRAWREFDRKNAGKVSAREFRGIVRKVVGLNFDQPTMDAVWLRLDPSGSGEMKFDAFCSELMGSHKNAMTSMTDMSGKTAASNASGNTQQFLLRKVRAAWKSLIAAFKHETRATGSMTPAQLRDVLFRHDIILADKQFEQLVKDIDVDGDGTIDYSEFLGHFAVGSEADKNVSRVIEVPTNKKGYLQNAKQQIRDKIEGRIASGPSGLRRAFQFFDRDGGGTIDLDEFKVGLEKYCGLKFTDTFVEELMNEFDDGSGSITYHSFCELVMGSKSTDATGFVAPTPKAPPSPSTRQSLFTLEPPEVAAPPVMDATGIDRTDIAGIKNFIIERVEAKNANLSAVFRKFDEDKSGNLSYPEFRKGLLALGIPLNQEEFDILIKEVDNDGGGVIDYAKFVEDMEFNVERGLLPSAEPAPQPSPPSQQPATSAERGDVLNYVSERVRAKGGSLESMLQTTAADYGQVRQSLLRMGIPLHDTEFSTLVQQWSASNPQGVVMATIGEDAEVVEPSSGSVDRTLQTLRAQLRDEVGGAAGRNRLLGSGARSSSRASSRRGSAASSTRRGSTSKHPRRRPSLADSVKIEGDALVLQ